MSSGHASTRRDDRVARARYPGMCGSLRCMGKSHMETQITLSGHMWFGRVSPRRHDRVDAARYPEFRGMHGEQSHLEMQMTNIWACFTWRQTTTDGGVPPGRHTHDIVVRNTHGSGMSHLGGMIESTGLNIWSTWGSLGWNDWNMWWHDCTMHGLDGLERVVA